MITLEWPPTVNNYYTVARGRKILSVKGRNYKQAAWADILTQDQKLGLNPPISVFIRAYPPDKRKRDLDNILKPVLDALTAAAVFDDDSMIDDLRIQRFEQSSPGRIEIVVSGADDEV